MIPPGHTGRYPTTRGARPIISACPYERRKRRLVTAAGPGVRYRRPLVTTAPSQKFHHPPHKKQSLEQLADLCVRARTPLCDTAVDAPQPRSVATAAPLRTKVGGAPRS